MKQTTITLILTIILVSLSLTSNVTKRPATGGMNSLDTEQSEFDTHKKITYVRLFADANGDTHLEEVFVKLSPTMVTPPALPLYVSAFDSAREYGYYSASPGWSQDWHNAPRRQFLFYLAGESEIEVSDGEIRRFGPGSILLAEDIEGRGHISRVVGSKDVLAVVIVLE